MNVGQKAKVDPRITGLKQWIEGVVIRIRNNPFLGKEIIVQGDNGIIYFDQEQYFKSASK